MNLLNLTLLVFFVIFIIVIGKILVNKNKTSTSVEDNNIEVENKKEREETTKVTKEISSDKIENKETQEEIKEEKINLPEEIKILQKEPNEIMELVAKDIQNAMVEYDMDEETIKEMYKELEGQFDNQKLSIYNYLEQGAWGLLEREIHSLKGATLNLKFNTIGNAIRYIDDLLKEIEQNKKLEEKDNIKLYIDILFEAKEKIFKNL